MTTATQYTYLSAFAARLNGNGSKEGSRSTTVPVSTPAVDIDPFTNTKRSH